MSNHHPISEGDPVFLEDVWWVAQLYRTSRGRMTRPIWKAYRDRYIRACYEAGDVTRAQLAEMAQLSISRIDAILRAGRAPWPRPKLRLVK